MTGSIRNNQYQVVDIRVAVLTGHGVGPQQYATAEAQVQHILENIGSELKKLSCLFFLVLVSTTVLFTSGCRDSLQKPNQTPKVSKEPDSNYSEENSSSIKLLCTTNAAHEVTSGSIETVTKAIREGADLRRFSTYKMKGTGFVEETMTLQTTWVFDDGHVGGLQTLRHPLDAGLGISMQPCMALWIFGVGVPQRSTFVPMNGKPMENATGLWVNVDNEPFGTVTGDYVPSRYQWWARNDWKQICAHDKNGLMSQGSWKDIRKAVIEGRTLKVGITNLWSSLTPSGEKNLDHEVFLECTTDFSHLDEKFVGILTQPTFLLQPSNPLKFSGENFRYGWLVVRSDGKVQRQMLNPSNMQWEQTWDRYAVRWFAR